MCTCNSMSSFASSLPRQKRATCIKELKRIVDNVNDNNVLAGNSTVHNVDNVKQKLQELLLIASKSPFKHANDLNEYMSLLETLLGPVLHEYYPFFNEEFKRDIFDSFFLPKSNLVNENNNNSTSFYKMGEWDGKLLNGNDAPLGTYVYEITYRELKDSERKILSGTVILIR